MEKEKVTSSVMSAVFPDVPCWGRDSMHRVALKKPIQIEVHIKRAMNGIVVHAEKCPYSAKRSLQQLCEASHSKYEDMPCPFSFTLPYDTDTLVYLKSRS